MQDTTSSAMTEVALGLSMAFFTLLIVALLSMSVPKENHIHNENKGISDLAENFKMSETIDITMHKTPSNTQVGTELGDQLGTQLKNKDDKKGESTIQFAFYFDKIFYDKSLTKRTIDSYSKEETLVIAVDPTLAFSQVFALRQKIKHPKLSITTSNETWRTRLKQIITVD